jgi:hypothetical protein
MSFYELPQESQVLFNLSLVLQGESLRAVSHLSTLEAMMVSHGFQLPNSFALFWVDQISHGSQVGPSGSSQVEAGWIQIWGIEAFEAQVDPTNL